MKKIIYLFLLAFAFFQTACKKEKLMPYELEASINMYKQNGDSTVYSFAVKEENVAYDTIKIPLRIMGLTAPKDRVVNYGVIPEKTTVSTANYELLPVFIPANSSVGTLMVKVIKTEELRKTEGRIWITLGSSSDFKPGTKELQTFLIRLNNFLSKPSFWDEIRFGPYSQVKYGLIIRETGFSEFSNIGVENLIYIRGVGRNYVANYLRENGTELLDENKVPVRFP
ncbi:DUF4843 domain-containing protein [Pedobacter gandavensis]|uniref:DUF4843 domain-containing protein n=1 Tax=Pedobacter gandavensis TaxID=2679963 RepID=UPI00292FDDE7|nr:DUF4843 domain-containing protein [Pedobacter gandavensis]